MKHPAIRVLVAANLALAGYFEQVAAATVDAHPVALVHDSSLSTGGVSVPT